MTVCGGYFNETQICKEYAPCVNVLMTFKLHFDTVSNCEDVKPAFRTKIRQNERKA